MICYLEDYDPTPGLELEDKSRVVKVKAPVLMFHGLKDWALLPGALNDTWKWVEKDLSIVTIPGSSHFVQQDAAEFVSKTMRTWLDQRYGKGEK